MFIEPNITKLNTIIEEKKEKSMEQQAIEEINRAVDKIESPKDEEERALEASFRNL